MDDKASKEWITIKALKKFKDVPSEIKIDMSGTVFIDGKPYSKNNTEYPNLSVDVERHSKRTAGEETKKIIEKSKEAKRGETVTIKDTKSPDRVESTIVKF